MYTHMNAKTLTPMNVQVNMYQTHPKGKEYVCKHIRLFFHKGENTFSCKINKKTSFCKLCQSVQKQFHEYTCTLVGNSCTLGSAERFFTKSGSPLFDIYPHFIRLSCTLGSAERFSPKDYGSPLFDIHPHFKRLFSYLHENMLEVGWDI